MENNNNHLRSNSSSSSFFEKNEDNPPALEDIDSEKLISRPPSRISNTSKLSSINKTNENLIKETYLSSTTASVDDPLFLDKQFHSPGLNEHQHEFPRLSTSSIDSQQKNETISENQMKSDTISSDDEFQLNSLSKLTRQNQAEGLFFILFSFFIFYLESLSIQSKNLPQRQYFAVENILVVWLDLTLDNSDQVTLNFKSQITRPLRIFTDPQKCIELFEELKNHKILLIISGNPSQTILEQMNDYSQLVIIYIFSQQESNYEKFIDQYPKIKGIYTELTEICEDLKIDLKQWDNDLNTFEISSTTIDDKQLLFIQNQLFKEYLLEIRSNHDSIHNLMDYCQKIYHENDREIQLIQEFERNYQSNQALDWYIKDCFVYDMLNRAMQMKDMKILFQMRFFIHDIHRQLEEIHSTTVYRSTFTVYRGQG